MDECIFCNIVAGKIPAKIVFQDDDFCIFNDINPQAPVHFLGVPAKHIATISELTPDDAHLVGDLLSKLGDVAKQFPELKNGYRIVSNCGRESGQTVFHIHFHLLGGRRMTWPPG